MAAGGGRLHNLSETHVAKLVSQVISTVMADDAELHESKD
jgi:hypothetical protein